nr:hypothetical protein [Tanacetum cinerariifolium]
MESIRTKERLQDLLEDIRIGNVDRARETVGSTVVQKSWIQCYNCKEFRHVARECQKPKRVKDAAYHMEKMLLYQELEAHYMYLSQLQVVSPDAADSGPIFDDEPLQKNDDDDLVNERELLASLIEKLKCEIDERKNCNKLLETSNKVLVEKLKGEIEDFKNNNKSLESSNNSFKEANNKLSETNNLLYTDFKKSQAELAKRNSMEYPSQMEIEFAKKEAQIKLYKNREDKELDKVIALENKVKKAQRANPRLYDIGCYNDNLALMLAPESDEVIRLEKESRSKNAGYEHQRLGNVAGARETVGSTMPKRAKDAAYHREKMLLCKHEKAGIQLNAEQADWKDDTDDESDDQEL